MHQWIISPPGMPFALLMLPKRKPNVGVLEFGCWSPERNFCSLCTGVEVDEGWRSSGQWGQWRDPDKFSQNFSWMTSDPNPGVFMTLTLPPACENPGFRKSVFRTPVEINVCVQVAYFLICLHLSWKKPVCCLAVSWYTSCAKSGCKYPSLSNGS